MYLLDKKRKILFYPVSPVEKTKQINDHAESKKFTQAPIGYAAGWWFFWR